MPTKQSFAQITFMNENQKNSVFDKTTSTGTFVLFIATFLLCLLAPLSALASTPYIIKNADAFLDNIHEEYGQMISIAALLHDYDPKMIAAVIVVESEGRKLALSNKGARGLMQLMPGTAKAMGAKDPKDPFQNILAGTRYLKELADSYGFHNSGDALVAYNMGPSRAKRWLSQYDSAEYGYVKNVMYVHELLVQRELAERKLAAETSRRLENHWQFSRGEEIVSQPKDFTMNIQPYSIQLLRRNILESVDE